MPIISIVIPSYNHEDFLPEAVQSCLNQSINDLELIVVDDGSKDRSVPYLWSVDDPRLRIVEQSNQGAHAAINRGLSIAKGSYLTILNSDDRFDRKRLERILDEMVSTRAEFGCSWLRQIDRDSKPGSVKKGWDNQLPGWANYSRPIKKGSSTEFLEHLAHTNFISTTSNMVFTRRLFEKIGGMRNLRFCHDWDFALRAACEFKCTIIEKSLLDYRTHGANTIHSNDAWMKFEVLLIMAMHLADVDRALEKLDGNPRGYCNQPPLKMPVADKVYIELVEALTTQRLAGQDRYEERLMDSEELRKPFVEAFKKG